MASAIRAEGLVKRFGARTAVDHVDLDVPVGSCFGFLGPNGAGKTTLIRLLLGLARPNAGQVVVDGVDVQRDPTAALRSVGAIVEEPRFHPHLTGVQALEVHAALLADPAAARERVDAVLEQAGLAGRGHEKVKTYSMGMRQRLGVARALLGDPRILVLDEPTNGLDAAGMASFRTLVRHLVEVDGRTVFLSSHLLDEMQKLCDAVAIVDAGKVVTQTSVADLLRGTEVALLVDCDDPAAARAALDDLPVAATDAGLLRVVVEGDARTAAMAVTRRLVQAGVGVAAIGPETRSLEERFLEVTDRP